MSINIQPVTTIEECRAIEEIIQAAWGSGPEMSVPDHVTITLAKENGSVVLLARDDDKPVGFCLGFLSYVGEERRLKHCSHLTAVIPEYRGRRVGERIKWAQREAVLAMGIDHITWTYDPLETLNGRLNIHKLGAICNTYQRNVYGDGRDALNWGVPTDRFYVDWWLASARVEAHDNCTYQFKTLEKWQEAGAQLVNPPTLEGDIWQWGPVVEDAFDHEYLLAAVPKYFQQIKKNSVELGLAWRLHTRIIFERAFANGFVAIDMLVDGSLCYYLLQKKSFERKEA